MGEWAYCNVLKSDAQTVVAKTVLIQFEPVLAKEAMEYQGGDPHFTYRCYTRQLPTTDMNLVQQRYYLVDVQNLDPITGTNRKYLIISDPHIKRLMMAWEWIAYRYRGT